MKQRKWDEALAAFRAAAAKDPEMSAAWFAIGVAEGQSSGKSTEAEIEAYERCIELDPFDGRGWLGLSQIRLKQNRHEEAVYG